jgi:hypothetical protein
MYDALRISNSQALEHRVETSADPSGARTSDLLVARVPYVLGGGLG